jgi:hypothetical protein
MHLVELGPVGWRTCRSGIDFALIRQWNRVKVSVRPDIVQRCEMPELGAGIDSVQVFPQILNCHVAHSTL